MGKKKKDFDGFRNHEKPPFKTVKTTLKSILLNKDQMHLHINQIVCEINDLVIHSYQFIRLYILECYHNQSSLPDINEKFITYCIKTLGVKDKRGRKPKDTELLGRLKSFYKVTYQPLLNHTPTSLKNKSRLIPYIATQIHTSLSNNVQERFIKHFLRFINKTTVDIECDKAVLFQFKNQLLRLEDTNEIFDDWKEIYLKHILPDEIKNSIHYDVKVKPFAYLKGMLYMNGILEEKESRLFQPLSLRNNIIPKHITLDTGCLIDLFGLDGKTKTELYQAIKQNQPEIWSDFLNLKHKVFKNKHYQFHYQIKTDGISCCLLFIRKDLKDKKWGSRLPVITETEYYNIEDLPKEALDNLKDRTIVGCDPGKHSLVYMMDDKGNKLQYTASQRKIESYGKRNQRILLQEKKRHHIIEKETELSSQNSKSVDIDKFKTFLVEKDKLNRDAREFYQRELWRKMGFRQYSYGNKSIDRFLNKIKETFGTNILIGYGNWSRSTQMKGIMPTMGRGLRKLIHKKYDTITINEANTSKKCCDCHQDLDYYKSNGKQIYRLLVCSNCVSYENKRIVFRTRDANSAINILKLAQLWIEEQRRPIEFQTNISSFTSLKDCKEGKVRQSQGEIPCC